MCTCTRCFERPVISTRDDRLISTDILTLTAHLPSRHLAADEVVYREGDALTTVLVLVEGQLEVERGGVVINRHGMPGSVVGEVSALLQQPRAGTVTAIVPPVIRDIHAPDDFFAENPGVAVRSHASSPAVCIGSRHM